MCTDVLSINNEHRGRVINNQILNSKVREKEKKGEKLQWLTHTFKIEILLGKSKFGKIIFFFFLQYIILIYNVTIKYLHYVALINHKSINTI